MADHDTFFFCIHPSIFPLFLKLGMDHGVGSFIEIPEHLKYRAPVVHVNYSGVQSRYNSPSRSSPTRAKQEQLEAVRSSPLPPKNPAYAAVASRFQAEHRPRSVPSSVPEPLSRKESVRYSQEVQQARKDSKLLHRVTSKYFEVFTVSDPSGRRGTTPRAAVEEKKKREDKALMKEGTTFKVSIGKNDDFDSMRKGNVKLNRQSPQRSKDSNRTSVVMEWVRHGTAIPTDRPPSPSRRHEKHSDGKPFYLPGGAGGGQFQRTSTSPVRPIAVSIEKHVGAVTDRLRSARTSSPPRVASQPHPRTARAKGKLEIEADTQQRMPRMLRDNLHPHPGATSLARTTSPTRSGRGVSTTCSQKAFSRATTAVSVPPADSPPPRSVVRPTGEERDDVLSTVSDSTEEGTPSRRKSGKIPLVFPKEGPGVSPRRDKRGP